jgi:hypothetical protein
LLIEILILLVLIYIGLGVSNLNASINKHREEFILFHNNITEQNKKIATHSELMEGSLNDIHDYLSRYYINSLPDK